jgi:predicted ATPase
MMERLRILVVGAGLAVARSLRRAGFEPEVIDRVAGWDGAGTGIYLPELHRLRGDLLARDGRRGAEAADAYGRAIEIAAGHGTRSPQLRAAVRQCRLPAPARPGDVRARLQRLYDQFEEGFDTPDLRAARTLLDRG